MKLLTVADYFKGYKDHPGILPEHITNAELLLSRVNLILNEAFASGQVDLEINPVTRTLIAGATNGGWRPKTCPEGAPNSSHKTGQGVDLFDGDGDIDEWLFDHPSALSNYGLYIEHPSATRGWCHITTRAPKSGKRVFFP